MGMYTQLHMNFSLFEKTPPHIINKLNGMINDTGFDEWKDNGSRLNWCLNSSSYYFDNTTNSKIEYDGISRQYRVLIHCDFKNYNNEIDIFISWIMPFIDAEKGRFIGYSRYEEDIEPKLYYKKG